MAEKLTNKERLREITARIEQGVKEVFTSGKYADYLRTMSRFTHYSANNRILIFSQNPSATHVAGYQAWQNKFERHVVKGAKGITIIAPTPYKKKIEEEKLDPETKLPMLDENGDVIITEKEIRIPMFKPVTVFDVSQTEGKPLPVLAETLVGDVQNYEVFMEAIKRSSPVPISVEPMQQNLDGYFSLSEQNIHLREGMREVQTVCAAIHEITHAKLHNSDAEEQKSHKVEEIEAESVAYSVCAYYKIETDANSFGYIANYVQGKSINDLKNSLDLIAKTADEIISDIDRNYAELMKERDSELHVDDVEQRFLNNPTDAMAIFQLKSDAPAELRFMGLAHLDSPPDKANYAAVYTQNLVPDDNTARILENFYCIFNEERPADFTGHSLSVSDIIALKREGVVSYHYCDSIGFVELPDFGKESPLKNAEMLLEDDYSMLDGRINNGQSALAEDKKPSVLEQLKTKETTPKIPKSPKKTKENER